jgi:hypothetical protein
MSNIIKKTNRTNKTNLVVKWLPNYFTIKQLLANNSNFVQITLRSRLDLAKQSGLVTDIGHIHNGKGRPELVFAMTPVAKETLESARNAGILFNEKYNAIQVMNVNTNIPTTNTVKPTSVKTNTEVVTTNA